VVILIMRSGQQEAWLEVLAQLEALIRDRQDNAAHQSLRAALSLARRPGMFLDLLRVLEQQDQSWLEHGETPVLYADLLLRLREFKRAKIWIERFLKPLRSPDLLPLWALVQLRMGFPAAAHITAKEALSSNENSGLVWQILAETSRSLGEPDWALSFERACALLKGRAKGLCLIMWGSLLELDLQHGAARRHWAEAWACFDDDPRHQAQLLFNMGLSCIRDDRIEEAERHFDQLLKRSRHPEALDFTARAWCGFGVARRAVREWSRAEEAYRRAAKLSEQMADSVENADDRVQAWRGLGHTLRLAGHSSAALIELHRALEVQLMHDIDPPWVQADIAAACMANNDTEGALTALQALQDKKLDLEDEGRCNVVRALIAMQHNDPSTALEHVRGVRWQALWAREELEFFPTLRKLLEVMGVNLPDSRMAAMKTAVEVRAMGALRVVVNGRGVRLPPCGRAGQVLVLLLENNHSQTMLQLLEALYPEGGRDQTQARRKLISKAVTELRKVLGWKTSVLEMDSSYSLDPKVDWFYDVHQAQTRGEPINVFMVGVEAEWVSQKLGSWTGRILN
jgi:tetratricopeptide (TPR) repeat protein